MQRRRRVTDLARPVVHQIMPRIVSKQNVGGEDQMQHQHGATGALLVMADRDDSKVPMKPPQACGIDDPR